MSLKTMMNAIRKRTESVSYNESSLAHPTGYIDTGCLAVNRIISGSIYNGIPEGRITTFFGESGCVPADRTVKILVKVNEVNFKYLNSQGSYSVSEYNCSYDIKLNWLLDIGFSLSEVSRETKISRVSLLKIKNGKTATLRYATKAKLDSFIDRNIFEIKIGDISNIIEGSKVGAVLIKTPNGFRECGHLIQKGPKECLEFILENNKCFVCSNDHLVMNKDNNWIFAENLILGDEVITEFGIKKIVNKSSIGIFECVDIEIFDDEHSYYIDGVASHNSGKSRIVAQIIINALTKNNYDMVFYFDSEGGGLYDFIKKSGVDMSKIEHVLISNTEEAASKMLTTYANIEEEIKIREGKPKADDADEGEADQKEDKELSEKKAKKLQRQKDRKETTPLKILCVLDSFGMLVSTKTMTDAVQKDKMVSDMGGGAKLKNSFIKAMTIPVMKTNAALVILNHIYDNPAAMFSSKIKEQPGGKGLQFASHIILQSTKYLEKDKENGGLVEGESYFKGNNIKYFTVKNRLIKLGYEAQMFIDLNYGISKYDGLIEDAKRYGYITGPIKKKYFVPTYSDKPIKLSQLLKDDAIWDTFIKEFNDKSEKDMQYGNSIENTLENEVDDDEDESEEVDELKDNSIEDAENA